MNQPTSSLQDSSLPHRSSTTKLLPPNAKPPKSKTEPYYSIHPQWTDVIPIPQMDLDQPSTFTTGGNPLPPETAQKLAFAGPALATIAYTPRYTEGMSYLRAVMSMEEYSERTLGLTEDIISMNPAHYTVWIYRFRVLKELWGPLWKINDKGQAVLVQNAVVGFEKELKWLEKISERNLKNYQIWHHRQSLFQLLPISPDTSAEKWVTTLLNKEPTFLGQILALDTKNYHVWSYRQWLCAHFYEHYLIDNSQEVNDMNAMIHNDVMNNSAWNHRYFVIFGHARNVAEEKKARSRMASALSPNSTSTSTTNPGKIKGENEDEDEDDNNIIDLDLVEKELTYVKNQIRLAPQNGSSWNYLKGILKYSDTNPTDPSMDLKSFCSEFVGDGFEFDVVDPSMVSKSDLHGNIDDNDEASTVNNLNTKGVRSSQAIEMCIEIFASEVEDGDNIGDNIGNKREVTERDEKEGREYSKQKVRNGLRSLAEKWDPIRKRYWEWRLKKYEDRWRAGL